MSTSFLGPDLRTTLPILTGAFYTLGISTGTYSFVKPAAGAKLFGVVLPRTEPTPTEAAYTKITAIRNIANGIAGLIMVGFLQFSESCTTLPTGPFAAAALRKVLGYSMVAGSFVAFTDEYVLQQFSQGKGLSQEAVEVANKQRKGHTAIGVPIALLGLGWIYA